MQDNNASLQILQHDVDLLRIELKANTAATKELVDAWKAARTFLTFMKFASGLATAIAGAWLLLRAGWHNIFD